LTKASKKNDLTHDNEQPGLPFVLPLGGASNVQIQSIFFGTTAVCSKTKTHLSAIFVRKHGFNIGRTKMFHCEAESLSY
jgi:hypothetical protein